MATVTLTQLVKTYPAAAKNAAFTAVKGINLEVRDGEFMVLVGPSGCGKSTTLRMIAGLEDITTGEIAIGNQVINHLLPKDRDIAMVFQNYALYPHMTVAQNMGFGLKLRKVPAPEIKTRVHEAATLLGLETMLDRLPKALSGGQRQRVAVGRAIVRQPKVFLFDEPLSNLDAKMRVSMRTEISKLHARLGATMIYVTHDQVEAMTMGDRICVMKDGEIQQVAAPLELYNHPTNVYVAGFIGSPPMNLIRGTLRQDGPRTLFVETTTQAPPFKTILDERLTHLGSAHLNKAVILGVRPEDLSETTHPDASPLRLSLAEPMGAETYLHLSSEAHHLIARVPPGQNHRIGQTVHLAPNLAKVHLFDAVTERSLS